MEALWARGLLSGDLPAQLVLIVGVLWGLAFPARRIYPMPHPDAWYYAL